MRSRTFLTDTGRAPGPLEAKSRRRVSGPVTNRFLAIILVTKRSSALVVIFGRPKRGLSLNSPVCL